MGEYKGLLGFALVHHETPEFRDISRHNQFHLMMGLLWGVKEEREVEGHPEVANCGDCDAWSTLGCARKGNAWRCGWGRGVFLSAGGLSGLKSH